MTADEARPGPEPEADLGDEAAHDLMPLEAGRTGRRRGWEPALIVGIVGAGAALLAGAVLWPLAGPSPAPGPEAVAVSPPVADGTATEAAAPDRPAAETPPQSEPVRTGALPNASPPPLVAPAVAPPPPMPVEAPAGAAEPAYEATRTLPADTLAAYLARGEELLKTGDLAAARLFFERVAEAGEARGALGLARSYDPDALSGLPVHGQAGDAAAAARWRKLAEAMGGAEEAAR